MLSSSVAFKFIGTRELVPTDGGRYDVDIKNRKKVSVYWEEPPMEVRRGSWIYKGPQDRTPIPYDEEMAAYLEVIRSMRHFIG
jgi:hypothetical protein